MGSLCRRSPLARQLSAWTAFVAVAALAQQTAFAVGGPAPGAVTAQTVKLPSGPGSVRGLADDASVNSFTGQVQYAVPIELPHGPGGLAPSLSIGYDGSLGNGPLGVGWDLSQSGIRRSLRLGVPSYDASDELEALGVGGGGQLVALDNGEYRLEGEGNAYTGRAVDGGFELRGPDGTTYRLGTSALSRKASGAMVAVWYLEQVKDVAGQVVDYRYRQDRGEVYLDSIEWGPLIGTARAFRAELVYATRNDAVVSYRTGFRVESAQRLAQIRVSSFAELQRVVTLGYDESPPPNQLPLSRLHSIRVTSPDGVDALPTLTFNYAAASPGQATSIPGLDGWALNVQGTSLFDVDDDGAMDLLRLTGSGHSYRRNLAGSFAAPVAVPGADGATLDKVRLLDLTGDSGAEMVWQQGSQWRVFQLSGDSATSKSWTSLGSWAGATNVSLSTVALADLDGDYRMDVLSVSGSRIQVRMGNAAGLDTPQLRAAIDPTRSFIQPGAAATSFPDLNGDGLADVAYLATSAIYLYLGKGNGTFEHYRDLPYPWTGTVDISQIRICDLNRDGLFDVVAIRGGNVSWYRGLANGTVETTPVELPRPPGTDSTVIVALADINGNGSEDVVWSSPAGMWVIDLAGPTNAGMLISIENGLGQTQQFGYTASAQLALSDAAAGAPWVTTVPVSIPVAVQHRLAFASGEPTRSTRLDVRDGIYDRSERRFIGFAEATTSRPDPADGARPDQIVRRIQRFAPGLGLDRVLRGQVLSERIATGNGTVLQDTTHDVAAATVAGLPDTDGRLRRAIVRSTEVHHFEGQASPLTTRTEYSHDDEGRVTEERRLGRLDITGDESTIRTRYTDGRSGKGVRDEVCEQRVIGSDGASPPHEVLTSHVQTLYGDDLAVAPLCDAGAGWTRAVKRYLASEARWIADTEITYSAHGNPLRTTEGMVARELTYDASDLHPIAEVIRPTATRTLRWEMEWNNVIGEPVVVRDATGVATEIRYDGLGRIQSLARGGHAPYLHYRYHLGGPRPSVETFTYDGTDDAVPALPASWTAASRWRHNVAAYTSAGEPLFQATRLDAARWLVGGRRQRDALGRTTAISEAFEWQGTLANLTGAALPNTAPVRTVAYDALDRPTVQTIPTGGRNTYAYRAFETTVTTDGLAPVTTFLDGQARIRRTVRTIGGVAEAVEADYDAAGHITTMRLPTATGAVEHRFTYDTLGRLVSATDPDIGDREMTWDDGGQLVSQTNAAGQTIEFSYDGAGRLTEMTGEDSEFVYHYDDALDASAFPYTAGRLAWIEEPTGRVQLGYDAAGREVRRRRTVGTRTGETTTSFAASGIVLSTGDGDGLSFDIAYDPAGRATGLGSLWQLETQDAAGRPLRERFGNGVIQSYQRDALGQATRVQVQRPTGAALFDASIAYNLHGAIASVTDVDGVGLDHSAAFTYDGGGRLIDALLGTGSGAYHFRYEYDRLQNMVRREAHGPTSLGMLIGQYRYAEAGAGGPRGPRQLTSIVPDAAAGSPAGATPTTFDYDAAGRTIRNGSLNMDYNGFDQLVRVRGLTRPGGGAASISHDYGYDGLRIRTVDVTGHQTLWFSPEVSETDDGVRQLDVKLGDRTIARITRNPTATAGVAAADTPATSAGVVGFALGLGGLGLLFAASLRMHLRRRRASWRPALGVAALIALVVTGCSPATSISNQALRTTTQTVYYHRTVGAGASLITRSDGSVFEERRYEPFGAAIGARQELPGGGSATGPIDYARDPHNVLNKLSDPATGWSDHGARWLAPETARWLTPDPPVKAPDPTFMSAPWALHPYQYVEQNPILYWDPDGREVKRKGEVVLAEGALVKETKGPLTVTAFSGKIKTQKANVVVEGSVAKIALKGSAGGINGSAELKAGGVDLKIGRDGVGAKLTAVEVKVGASYGPVKASVGVGVGVSADAQWGDGKFKVEMGVFYTVKLEIDARSVGNALYKPIELPSLPRLANPDVVQGGSMEGTSISTSSHPMDDPPPPPTAEELRPRRRYHVPRPRPTPNVERHECKTRGRLDP
jgi:RHS repeat-associated protein